MSEEKNQIELKTIEQLLGYNFTIPSYQRGYRWTHEHVIDLIDDINEFQPKSDDDFYCLQPLVVCKNCDNYEIIDGQQRITTIFFILKYLEYLNVLSDDEKKYVNKLSIKYAKNNTKENDFFENLTHVFEYINKMPNIQNESFGENFGEYSYKPFIEKFDKIYDTIENFYYFQSCFQIVKSINQLKEKEIFKINLLEKTKFIWYENNDNSKSHELFKRLNIGRIPLTNAELIKALFLCNLEKENEEIKEIEQRKLAEEWDNIEIALQNEEFWYFLTKETDKRANHIELIFDLLKDDDESNNNDNQTRDDYHTFYYFKNKYKKDKKNEKPPKPNQTTKETWEKVRICFNVLQEWYYNRELFHLIGYLILFNKPIVKIYKLREKEGNLISKSTFIENLKNDIKIEIDLEATYNNKEKVRKVLLAFNIATILSDKESNSRFSFARFKKNKWDIEHITPQNPKEINSSEKRKAWLDQFKNEDFYSNDFDFSNEDNWAIIKKQGIEVLEKKSAEYTDSIDNLTLLTDGTNRGIGNKTFYEKRAKIIEYAKQGAFIPPCSMNVFLKLYNDNPKDLYFWTEIDREKYLEQIDEKLKFFNPPENNNGK